MATAMQLARENPWPLEVVREHGAPATLQYVSPSGVQSIAGVDPSLQPVLEALPTALALRFTCALADGAYLNVRNLWAVDLAEPEAVAHLADRLPDAFVAAHPALLVPRARLALQADDEPRALDALARALTADQPGAEQVYTKLSAAGRLHLAPAYARWASTRKASWELLGTLPLEAWTLAHLKAALAVARAHPQGVYGDRVTLDTLVAELDRRGAGGQAGTARGALARRDPRPLAPHLLAKLGQAPDAEGLAVYQDALLDSGHPLGEFIALQRSGEPADQQRAEKLRRKHERDWLGALTGFLEDVEYRDGLPWKAQLRQRPEGSLDEALRHPLLATIEVLLCRKSPRTRMGRPDPRTYLAFVAAMLPLRLRQLDGCSAEVLAALEPQALGELTHLHDVRPLNAPTRAALRTLRAPKVSWVELSAPAHHLERVLEQLEIDDGIFRRNRPDVVVHFTTGLTAPVLDLARAALALLPVASLRVNGVLVTPP